MAPIVSGVSANPHDLLLECLPLVEETLARHARRHRLSADEAEELAGEVRLKLLADDCAVLRRFEGRSSLQTYLVTVVHRLLLDLRIAERGKWRPTAGARRLGAVAIDLEREIDRDGRRLDEAVSVVAGRHGCEIAEVLELARTLPDRALGRPRLAGDVDAASLPSADPDPLQLAEARELATSRLRARSALDAALSELAAEDRVAIRLRFAEGLEIGAIADALGTPRRPFYRRLERVLGMLRERLEAAGVDAPLVNRLVDLGDLARDPGVAQADVVEITARRPSPPQPDQGR